MIMSHEKAEDIELLTLGANMSYWCRLHAEGKLDVF